MNDFFKRGFIVVVICLVIYFVFFFASVCLKVNFPKLNPSKCPENYEVSLCGDNKDISCCKLKDTSNIGVDPNLNIYFENLRTKCDKEEIKIGIDHWDPNIQFNGSIKKYLCKWGKKGGIEYSNIDDPIEKRKQEKLNSCFVPWDGITNGLDNDDGPIC